MPQIEKREMIIKDVSGAVTTPLPATVLTKPFEIYL
jgi:hypothetical protein